MTMKKKSAYSIEKTGDKKYIIVLTHEDGRRQIVNEYICRCVAEDDLKAYRQREREEDAEKAIKMTATSEGFNVVEMFSSMAHALEAVGHFKRFFLTGATRNKALKISLETLDGEILQTFNFEHKHPRRELKL